MWTRKEVWNSVSSYLKSISIHKRRNELHDQPISILFCQLEIRNIYILPPSIACAPGTYKDYVGLATKGCTDCPLNSGHNKHGSSRRTDCECNKGYEGNPGSGKDCTSKLYSLDKYTIHFA